MRVYPRIMVTWYGYWMGEVIGRILDWYFTMKPEDRTTQVTAVITVVIPGIFGLAVWLAKIYMSGGRVWGPSTDADGHESHGGQG